MNTYAYHQKPSQVYYSHNQQFSSQFESYFLHLFLFFIIVIVAVVLLVVGKKVLDRMLDKWWWIDFTKGVDRSVIQEAKQASAKSKAGALSPNLPFTEGNFKNVLLYDHIRKGQIDPMAMRRMKREYLNYIAGMDFPHPDLSEPRKNDEHYKDAEVRHGTLAKIQGNVSRAKYELLQRNLFWTTLITTIAALVGGMLGSLIHN